jgi:AraC-like DNA-binding protein
MVLPIPKEIIRPMQRTRSGALHFSADNLSTDDRVSYWRELFGRQMIGLDIEPLPDAEFFGDLTLHALPGLKICRGITSGGRTWRTQELISDGNDDVSLWINLEGPVAVSRRGEEIVLGEQEAVLGTMSEVGGFTRRMSGRHLCLQIPRAAIAPLVPAVDDAVARRIRLLRAHRMRCAPLHMNRAIGSIAFECGFSDLSYFYRVFRRKYDDTPSDVRESARREQE